jgi:RND family efflux transporter MFP subunit
MKKVIVLLVILGAVAYGGYRLLGRHSSPETKLATTVARLDDIRQVVQCVGTAEPIKKLDVKSQVPGRVTRVYVEEGDAVQQGALIAQIEATEYQLQVERARADLGASKQRLAQAEAAVRRSRAGGEEVDVAQALATSRAAKARLESARNHWQLVDQLEHRLEVARAQRAAAEATVNLAKAKLARVMQLHGRGIISAQEEDQARADEQVAEANLEASEQNVALMEAQCKLDRDDAQSEVSSSEAEYAASQEAVEHARANAAVKDRLVAEARADVQRAQVALETAMQELRYTELRAPMAGQVIYKGVEEGETVSPEGRAAAVGTVIATIASTAGMIVNAEVDDTDIGKISAGQKALLSVGAGELEPYHGEVVYIAGRSTVREGEVPTFRVKLAVKDPDRHLRPGMTVNVDLVCEERKQAVVVPYGAVNMKGGAATVSVLSNGKPATRAVEVGIVTPTAVEIVRGLKAGETVVLGAPTQTQQQ